MQKLFFTLIALLLCTGIKAQIWVSKSVTSSFFSSTPVEDIDAQSKTGASALNTKTNDIIFKINNTSFQFKKKLMQEHFNENYMESDKFPTSDFKGKIIEQIDFSKPGTYPVTVKGNLQIHGITKEYTTKGSLVIAGNEVKATSTFNVKLADHDIKIPTIVFKQIAEIIQVKVTAIYQSKK
ncbi:YceI-like domain-containing protein [Pedobacter terrae]|uniref:YceI-like domain-containing protein n=1 Tax=Pedobacter terrae TaxID=405671 RepID=A0A1G7SMH3_9SPHI|nr:YceI family protein [Pedobacter terrae]SDG23629.1 YceI-like domain-containing protein [Pedobacter terrae]